MKVKPFRESVRDIVEFSSGLTSVLNRMGIVNNLYVHKIVENAKWKALFLHDNKVVEAIEKYDISETGIGLYELLKEKVFTDYISQEELDFLRQFIGIQVEVEIY